MKKIFQMDKVNLSLQLLNYNTHFLCPGTNNIKLFVEIQTGKSVLLDVTLMQALCFLKNVKGFKTLHLEDIWIGQKILFKSYICDMDGPGGTTLSKISQTYKDKYHMISLACGI